MRDPELHHPFSHPGHPQQVQRLTAYRAEVLGGPPTYSRSCSTSSAMPEMHAGNGDVSDLGRRFVACFVAAADGAGPPADPAFRMPRRSWDGLVTTGGSPSPRPSAR